LGSTCEVELAMGLCTVGSMETGFLQVAHYQKTTQVVSLSFLVLSGDCVLVKEQLKCAPNSLLLGCQFLFVLRLGTGAGLGAELGLTLVCLPSSAPGFRQCECLFCSRTSVSPPAVPRATHATPPPFPILLKSAWSGDCDNTPNSSLIPVLLSSVDIDFWVGILLGFPSSLE
jgi:hypothetical protein